MSRWAAAGARRSGLLGISPTRDRFAARLTGAGFLALLGVTALGSPAAVTGPPSGGRPAVSLGHGAPIEFVAYLAGGSRVVTAARDHTARVWDVASQAELLRLDGRVLRLLDADARREELLGLIASETAAVWSARDGRLSWRGRPAAAGLRRGYFGFRRRIWLLDLRGVLTWQSLARPDSPHRFRAEVVDCLPCPNAPWIAVQTQDQRLELWEIAGHRRLWSHAAPELQALAFSPGGTQLYSLQQGRLVERNTRSGQVVRQSAVPYANWVQEWQDQLEPGRQAASIAFDRFRRRGLPAEPILKDIVEQVEPLRTLIPSPDGRQMLVHSWGADRVQCWDLVTGRELPSFGASPARFGSLEQRGHHLLAGAWGPGSSRALFLWDLRDGREVPIPAPLGTATFGAHLGLEGETLIAVGTHRGTGFGAIGRDLWLNWVTEPKLPPRKPTLEKEGYLDTLGLGRGYFAVCHGGETVSIWHVARGEEPSVVIPVESASSLLGATSTGGLLVTTHEGKGSQRISRWDPLRGIREAVIRVPHASAVAVDPSGEGVYFGDGAGRLRWVGFDGKSERELGRQGSRIVAATTDPEGRWLATVDEHQIVEVRSLPEGRRLARLNGLLGSVWRLCPIPRAKQLWVSLWNGPLVAWRIDERPPVRLGEIWATPQGWWLCVGRSGEYSASAPGVPSELRWTVDGRRLLRADPRRLRRVLGLPRDLRFPVALP